MIPLQRWFRIGTPLTALVGALAVAGCGGGSVATPAPVTGAVVLSSAALSFTGTGSANNQQVTVSQTSYSGTFTVSTAAAGQANSCSGIATVSPAGGAGPFTVTPVAVGNCTFTVSGGSGQTAPLTIDVTTTTVGGS